MKNERRPDFLSRARPMLIAYAALSAVTGALLFMESLDHGDSFKRWLVMCGAMAVVLLALSAVLEGLRAIGFDFDTLSKEYKGPKDSFAIAVSKRILSLGLKLFVLVAWGALYLAVHDLPYKEPVQDMAPALLVVGAIATIAIVVDEVGSRLWARFRPKQKSPPSHLA